METPFIPPLLSSRIEVALGALFIMVFGWQRFNRPVHSKGMTFRIRAIAMRSRYSTTAVSFFGAFSVYVAFLLLSYLFLQLYYPAIKPLLENNKQSPGMEQVFKSLSPPLLCALILTILLPSVPYLK